MDQSITKNKSKILYGIAILMMVYHHLFCIPERIVYDYFSILDNLFPIFDSPLTLERRIAFFCKICVAIYSFLSGYGLCKSVKYELDTSIEKHFLKTYLLMLKRYLKFIFKTFLVAILLIIPFRLINNQSINIWEVLTNILGIDATYIGEWWYVKFYVRMLLIFPFINVLFINNIESKKKNIIYKLISIIVLILLVKIIPLGIDSTYFIIFLEGYIIARYKIFDYINTKLIKHKKIISLIILILVIIIRVICAFEAAYNYIDMFIIVPFIYSLTNLFNEDKKTSKIFIFFGKYSTFIWLTHTIFCYHYLTYYLTITHISILIFIMTLGLSILVAFILSLIEKLFYKIINILKKFN